MQSISKYIWKYESKMLIFVRNETNTVIMIFTAIANNGTKTRKENLDNFNELQEFMNKMELRGFLNVEVTASKCSGETKIINYSYNGQSWEK